jgi:hypothetical protein
VAHPYFTPSLDEAVHIVPQDGGAEVAPRMRRTSPFRALIEQLYADDRTVNGWPLWDMTGLWRHMNVQAIIDATHARRSTVLRNFHRYGFSVRWTQREYGDTHEPALYVLHPALRRSDQDWTRVILGMRVRDSTPVPAAMAAGASAAAAEAPDSAAPVAEPELQ